MKEIQWSSVAEKDYDSVLQYLFDNFGKSTVEDFQKKLEHTLNIILQNPFAFRFYKRKNIRKCVFNSQLSIYYLIEKDETIFLLSLFGKQNPSTLKRIIRKLTK